MTYVVCIALFSLGYALGHSSGHHKAFCKYWNEDQARQLAMTPRQWRIAYGYEKVTEDE